MNSDKLRKWILPFKNILHADMKDMTPVNPDDPSYNKYKAEVDRLTDEISHLVPGIERRGFRAWDLDHKIPIAYGFKHGIHPLKMACLSNLQVISHRENFYKGQKILFPLSILDQHDTIQSQLQDG